MTPDERPAGCVLAADDGGHRRLTARQVLDLDDPDGADELVGPTLRRAARTIVLGASGHGKTTLAYQLTAAAVNGGRFLNWTGAGRLRALIVDLEQGVRSVKRSIREAGLASSDDVDLLLIPDGLALDQDAGQLAELEQHIADGRHDIVMVDPFYKAHRGDANEERGVVDLMRALDGLRARHGFALLMPAHPRKAAGGEGARRLTLDDVAGSGAVTRGAEVVIAIERLSHGYARLRILKDRDGDLPVGDAWPLLFTRGEGFKLDPKEERTADELEQRIAATDDRWRTVKEWAAELGVREGRARALLEQLTESGAAEAAVGPPGRSPRAHCYRTAPDGWAQSGAVTQSLLESSHCSTAPDSLLGAVGSGAVDECADNPGAVDEGMGSR